MSGIVEGLIRQGWGDKMAVKGGDGTRSAGNIG